MCNIILLIVFIIFGFSCCKKIFNEPNYSISEINSTGEMNLALNGLIEQ
jgi:hypothetical protein